MTSGIIKIILFSVETYLKVDCNENGDGLGMLGNDLGLRRLKFFCYLNMPFLW